MTKPHGLPIANIGVAAQPQYHVTERSTWHLCNHFISHNIYDRAVAIQLSRSVLLAAHIIYLI